jgi:hypothetical protein
MHKCSDIYGLNIIDYRKKISATIKSNNINPTSSVQHLTKLLVSHSKSYLNLKLV